MQLNAPKIVAIVVTYNGLHWYDRCLGSLRDSSIPVQTIVIDNASTDGTIRYIQQYFPEVELVVTGDNLGFAKANNIGIQRALELSADYVFLLNQDAWIEQDTISKLLNTFDANENAGIVSPMHFNGKHTALDFGFASYLPTDFISDAYLQQVLTTYSLNFVNAAAWMVSIRCIRQVGGFDTSLFTHYGEDNNYCQRVRYHGFTILINSQTSICHDREYRQETESEYRSKHFAKENQQLARKMYMADINIDIDIDKQIDKCKQGIRRSYLRLKWQNVRTYRDELRFLLAIQYSRVQNMRGGLVWL